MDYRTDTVLRVPGRDDIAAAAARIVPHVRRTPVLETEAATFGIDRPLALKLELLQVTGSFKPRGAFNRMLTADVGEAGVVAASGGNFGLAVGHAARELGHRAEIFVPSTSPAAKIDRVRATGATVTVVEGLYDDASAAARERFAETGAVWMHPYDQFEVVAGQGTIGRELSEQVPDADSVLVAVGGGGLIGGIAAWFASDVRVVAVEPATSTSLHSALVAGEPVDVDVRGVAVDSLGTRRVGDLAFAIASTHVTEAVTVSDEAIRDAQRAIWRELRMFAEPGGAAALAALMTGAYRPGASEHVVVLLCGANGDPAVVAG
jgi:threonine dehydratase